jgi:hypothetical protein
MKLKNQFTCPIHGTGSLLIEEQAPTCCHKFAIRCKSCHPTFINWARASTVYDLLKVDPSIETKPYVPGITEFEKRFGRKP